ncbi:MAG: polysaccharide biosynthesis C-terminal domain-containing protein [Bacteroidetes bacterium]|nr:polysaccharide biosynthesis C-terminal domain-containing protein [Bacteroidota bacterium]
MRSKLKELSKDTVVYGISTIVGRFLGFILIPFYTQVFSTAEVGVYGFIYAYIAFFNIAFTYGMDAAFMKYSSIAKVMEKRKIFSTPYLLVFSSSFIISTFILLFKDSMASFLDLGGEYSSIIIVYVAGILFFDAVVQIPFANLRLERKTLKFASIKIINICINLSLNVIFILVYHYGIEAIFLANFIASFITFLILLPDLSRHLILKIDKEVMKKMIKFGIPYLPASLAAMLVQAIDKPIMRYMTDDSTLGVYQANYKLGIFMMLIVSMFQYAWQPFFLINAKDENAKELFSKVLTFFLIVAGLVWVVLTLFIEDVAHIEFMNGKTLIGHDFLEGLVIVPIILLGYVFHGMYVNFSAGVYIEEKTKYYPLVTGAGAIVNIVVNILLIPVMGIIGAALATLAAYMVMAGGLFLVSQKFYKIKYEYSKIVPLMAIIFGTGALYYYLYFNNALNLPYKFFILIGFLLLLILLRVVRFDELKKVGRALIRR